MDGHPQVGIAGSRLEWPDGSPQGSPFRFPGIASELDRGLKLGIVAKLLSSSLVIDPKPRKPSPVDWLGGTSMIIRREVIDAIGPLDEGLYTYFDDVDYCLNAKRAGWPTWFVPESRIIHLEGRFDRHQGKKPEATPRILVSGPAALFPEKPWRTLHSIGRRSLPDRLRVVALASTDPKEADTDPQHMLLDSFRNSVFMTGFEYQRWRILRFGAHRTQEFQSFRSSKVFRAFRHVSFAGN